VTIEEALETVQRTRSFIGTIEPESVVLDGPFRPKELEAIPFLMRNRALRPGSIQSLSRRAGGPRTRHLGLRALRARGRFPSTPRQERGFFCAVLAARWLFAIDLAS
jgi:hypothetical protein